MGAKVDESNCSYRNDWDSDIGYGIPIIETIFPGCICVVNSDRGRGSLSKEEV